MVAGIIAVVVLTAFVANLPRAGNDRGLATIVVAGGVLLALVTVAEWIT